MELLTITDAAQRANCTGSALRQAIRNERLVGVKLGVQWFVYAHELERYINERRTWKLLATQNGGAIDDITR